MRTTRCTRVFIGDVLKAHFEVFVNDFFQLANFVGSVWEVLKHGSNRVSVVVMLTLIDEVLPAVFIIENNLYAMGTPLYRAQPTHDLTCKADAFNMPSHRIDAFNVETVYDTVREAVVRARSGQGPTLIEMITYRFRGHSMSDPAKYRPPGELEEMKEKDPLDTTRERLKTLGITDATLTDLDQKIDATVEDAVTFADASPELTYDEMKKYVFS